MNKMNSGMTSTVAGITVAMICRNRRLYDERPFPFDAASGQKAPPRGQPCGKKRRSRD